MFRPNGHKEEEKPGQTIKNHREHQQDQYGVGIVLPDLALEAKVFHLVRT
jgi:hypothetical protein